VREQGGIWDRLTVTCALSFCLLVAGLSVGLVLGELREQLGISGVVAAAHGSAFGLGMLGLGAFGAGGSWRWPYALLTLAFATALVVAGRGARIPAATEPPVRVLPLFRRRAVWSPWLHIVLAVMVEFPVGIWAVVYLKEVGGASSGSAAALAAIWGLGMFVGRMNLPAIVRRFGDRSRSIAFGWCAVGATLMWIGPGLWPRVLGLAVVAVGAGPLYPLAVERLYERQGADTVSLGFVTALASGAAVTVGPLLLGVLADAVGLRNALVFVPLLAVLGVYTARPGAALGAPAPDLVATR
jgi:fucose permease